MKEKQEHIAIVTTSIAIFTKDEKGNLHGPVMNQEQMTESGVEHKQKFTISGFDKFECLKKLKEIVDGIKQKAKDD